MPSSPLPPLAFQTPPRKPRRPNRSPVQASSPAVTPFEPKRVYLIRHGQSQGQAASKHDRLKDPALTDCGLTRLGIDQAGRIRELLGNDAYNEIDLVVSSPLTRALQTAVTGFTDKPVTVHYDLREVGSTTIPENVPRKMKHVLRDLQDLDTSQVDVTTFEPEQWPRHHDTPPKVVRRDHIRRVFTWIASRPEKYIAVVCHYHVIRAALQDPWNCSGPNINPENGVPIACQLLAVNGRIRLEIVADDDDNDDNMEE